MCDDDDQGCPVMVSFRFMPAVHDTPVMWGLDVPVSKLCTGCSYSTDAPFCSACCRKNLTADSGYAYPSQQDYNLSTSEAGILGRPVSASQEMQFCRRNSLEERTSWAGRDRTIQHPAFMLGVVDLFSNTELALQDGHVMLYDTACHLLTSAYKAGVSGISCMYDAVVEEVVCRRGVQCCPSMHSRMLHDNTAGLQLLHTFRLVQSGTTLAGSIRQVWLFVFQLLWGER